ncbi:MAG: hypothetical protein MRZ61_08870 [Oscillospiraceae bacterium]|nr:hypothetical protein [Oscillospiraceae bacterium]
MKMKIKGFVSLLASAAMILSAGAVSVYAEEAGNETATFCFDTADSLSLWETYGSTAETGFKLSIDDSVKETGDGSLLLSENVTENIAADNQFGGAYISAEKLGLESFKGCTVQMSVYFDKDAAKAAEAFTVFSDGIIWQTSAVSSDNAGRWTKVSLTVPENADNKKIGFTIPVFSQYSGAAAYVDNIIIYNADGTAIANVGDEKISSGSIEVSIGTGARIALLVVLVVIILAVIGGIGYVVSSMLKKFT